MSRWLAVVLIVAAMGAVAGARPARTQEALSARINNVDTSDYPAVRATVTIVDAAGRPVTGLTPDAFTASSGGQPLPVAGLATSTDAGLPIAVVLAFDSSGSMDGPAITQAKEAGKALIEQLGPEDMAAVVAFADGVRTLQAFTGDRASLAAAIDSLVADGNTALYSGVAESAALARLVSLPRQAVVLLSDGQDYGSVSAVDRAGSLAAATQQGVPFFVVGLGAAIDQPYLEDLASASRGQLSLAPGPEALNGLYQAIGAVLRQQYVLTLDAAGLEGAGLELRVDVSHAGFAASALAPLDLPLAAVDAPPAALTPVPATPDAAPPPVAEPAAEEGGGSVLLPAALALAGLAVLGGGATAVFIRRHRRAGEETAASEEEEAPRRGGRKPEGPLFPALEQASPTPLRAWLQAVPHGQTYALGEWPVTIGFTSDCGICLPDGAGTKLERARIWLREGRYMLHNLSRAGGVTVSGPQATWAVLEDGDEIQVGASRLVFHERRDEG